MKSLQLTNIGRKTVLKEKNVPSLVTLDWNTKRRTNKQNKPKNLNKQKTKTTKIPPKKPNQKKKLRTTKTKHQNKQAKTNTKAPTKPTRKDTAGKPPLLKHP